MSAMTTEDFERALVECEALAKAQMAEGMPLQVVLENLLLTAEIASGGGMVASVLLVDETGTTLRHGAAPNLPGAYCAAIDGIAIGRGVGSCGTAASLGYPVYVADIETDELWADFRDLARQHMLRACWSTPIKDEADRVIATFAVYHHTPRAPTPEEIGGIGLIGRAVTSAILASRPSR